MKEKFLPIGTVVLLKNGKKKIMITGYLPQAKEGPKNIYDYSACIFPEGIISSDHTVVFNHDQIEEIVAEGYANEETEKFISAVKELVEKNGINKPKKAEVEMPAEAPAKEEPTTEVLDKDMEMPAPANQKNGGEPVGIDAIKPFSE